jgi:hypothetical protein
MNNFTNAILFESNWVSGTENLLVFSFQMADNHSNFSIAYFFS